MPFHVLLAHMSYTQYAQINVNLEPTAAIPFTPSHHSTFFILPKS